VLHDLTAGIVAGCVPAAVFAVLHRPVPEEGA
jgi:SulP family sulfate permease